MANDIILIREDDKAEVYSVLRLEQFCIIKYQESNYLEFNVDYLNANTIRAAHYREGIEALFADNIPLYNYAIKLYRKLKRQDKKLTIEGKRHIWHDIKMRNYAFNNNLTYSNDYIYDPKAARGNSWVCDFEIKQNTIA